MRVVAKLAIAALILAAVLWMVERVCRWILRQFNIHYLKCSIVPSLLRPQLTVTDLLVFVPWFEKLMDNEYDLSQAFRYRDLLLSLCHSRDRYRLLIIACKTVTIRLFPLQIDVDGVEVHLPLFQKAADDSKTEMEQLILYPDGYPNYALMLSKISPVVRYLFDNVCVTATSCLVHFRAQSSSGVGSSMYLDDVVAIKRLRYMGGGSVDIESLALFHENNHVFDNLQRSLFSIDHMSIQIAIENLVSEGEDVLSLPLAQDPSRCLPLKLSIEASEIRVRAINALEMYRKNMGAEYLASLIAFVNMSGLSTDMAYRDQLVNLKY